MADALTTLTSAYDYDLPAELVAQQPATPRDSSRILVYNKRSGRINGDKFYNIGRYLPPRSLIVLNQTKVVPARLWVRKPTGGKVELLYLEHDGSAMRALTNKSVQAGMRLAVNRQVYFTVLRQCQNQVELRPSFPIKDIFQILEKCGKMPLPPYIKKTPLTPAGIKRRYQTVFAEQSGSVAAPTASLHFTKRLLQKLRNQGHEIAFITLHVNLGTFAPLTAEHLKTNHLHREYFEVGAASAKQINRAKKEGRPIIAAGTTVARTLESAVDKDGNLKAMSGDTQLFIQPGYDFKVVDGLITNFHVPKSSLMMLVAALTGRTKLLELYQTAISQKYRFYSFGDAMLIL